MPEYIFSFASMVKLQLVFIALYGSVLLNRPRYEGVKCLLVISAAGTTLDLTQNVFLLHQELPLATLFTLILGPGYYWFIKGLINPMKFQWQNGKHLIPAISAIYILDLPQVIIVLGTISQLIYGYYVLQLLKDYHHAIQSETSFAESLNLDWVKYSMLLLIVSIVLDLIRLNLQLIIPFYINEIGQIITNGAAVLVICYLVLKLSRHPEIFSDFSLTRTDREERVNQQRDPLAVELFIQLNHSIIEQKWFLTPRLTLRSLSELTGLGEKDISWAIKNGGGG